MRPASFAKANATRSTSLTTAEVCAHGCLDSASLSYLLAHHFVCLRSSPPYYCAAWFRSALQRRRFLTAPLPDRYKFIPMLPPLIRPRRAVSTQEHRAGWDSMLAWEGNAPWVALLKHRARLSRQDGQGMICGSRATAPHIPMMDGVQKHGDGASEHTDHSRQVVFAPHAPKAGLQLPIRK